MYKALAFFLFLFLTPVIAKNYAQLATDNDIRLWYQRLMQPDNPSISCCGEADGYWADSYKVRDGQVIAIITDERDVPGRATVAPGTEIVIPPNKYKFDQGNPTGHGIVFLNLSQEVLCYITPGGG